MYTHIKCLTNIFQDDEVTKYIIKLFSFYQYLLICPWVHTCMFKQSTYKWFVVLTSFSRLGTPLRVTRWRIWFGINKFLWKCLFLLGGYCRISCLRGQIFIIATLFQMLMRAVWQGVITWRHHNIYSYLVIFTVCYGMWCGPGLVCRDRTLTVSQITCIILLVRRVVCLQGVFFSTASVVTLCLDYMEWS